MAEKKKPSAAVRAKIGGRYHTSKKITMPKDPAKRIAYHKGVLKQQSADGDKYAQKKLDDLNKTTSVAYRKMTAKNAPMKKGTPSAAPKPRLSTAADRTDQEQQLGLRRGTRRQRNQ